MKILAIRGCNLASLAGEFEIDLSRAPFADAGVFAIVGNTGAGKSTLLDALCVALFDRTPRLTNHSRVSVGRGDDDPATLGAHDARTLLRRGAAAGYAEVDFEAGDARRYRARWAVRRARNQTDGTLQDQTLSLVALDNHERFGGTKTETLKAIASRLGLSFDQFRRSALLAQGEFAAFLRADGRDRSELLERMTGTEIYSRLSVAAHLRATLAEQRLRDSRAAALAIPILDDAARATLEADHALATAAKAASRARIEQAEAAARWLAEAAARERALEVALAEQAAAAAAVDEAAALREELALRQRAAKLRGPLDAVIRIEREREGARDQLRQLDAACSAIEVARGEIAARRVELDRVLDPVRAGRIASGVMESHLVGVGAVAELGRAAVVRRHATNRESEAIALGRAALDDAAWLTARSALAAEIAGWSALDERFAEYASIATALAAIDRGLVEHEDKRRGLSSARVLVEADRELAGAALADARRNLQAFHERRGPTLDAARKREDEARRQVSDAERLVAIAESAATAVAERLTIARQLDELDEAARCDDQRIAELAAGGERACVLRDERTRALDELRRAAGYTHARTELRDGEPCPLCGALEHPWRDRGVLDDVIAAAQHKLDEAATELAAIASESAAIAHRAEQRERERVAAAARRAALDDRVTASTSEWRAQLVALGELLLDADPTGPSAGQLANDRLAVANRALEVARGVRHQAEAAAKAAADAQAAMQLAQASVDELGTRLGELDRTIGELDGSSQRLRGERAGRVERLGQLSQLLLDTRARWCATDQNARSVGAISSAHVDTPDTAKAGPRGANASASISQDIADARSWMATLVRRWQEHAGRVVEAEAVLAGASLALDRRAAELERAATEQRARLVDTRRRAESLDDELRAAERQLDATCAQAGWARGELPRLATRLGGARLDAANHHGGSDRAAILERDRGESSEPLGRRRDTAALAIDELLSLHAALASDGDTEQLAAELRMRDAEAQRTRANDELRGLHAALANDGHTEQLAAELSVRDAEALRTRAIADERRQLVGEHARSRPDDASLADAQQLDELAAALAGAERHASQLAAAVAADADARGRREAAFGVLAEDERKVEIDRVLGEVIGSHDGKLFRSFAQSLTLDGLLAVANSHLEELAPRYQLERIPRHDLEIQVIDRDLGDEVRSVQSLSGGEGFLVSLALALGLSSMSAHDVRVRTLLIDEGFGTLDPTTLDGALAVLDTLQATGRQIGVISHVPALIERVGAHVRVVQRGGGASDVVIDRG